MQKQPEILKERRHIWKNKAIIRKLYSKWYGIINEALRPGKVLELGGGSGNLREYFPEVLVSDVIFVPWLDAVLDAHELPFKNGSLDSIVLFDVLHHLRAPVVFLHEAARVLRFKGRVIMMEPYVSWGSFLVYKFLHPEGMKRHEDPFRIKHLVGNKDPFQGNQAIPTLMFEKYREKFISLFPHLRIIQERKVESFMYPLSGGFHHRSLCPRFFWKLLDRVETLLQPVSDYLSFRILIVLEKN